jgi:hypothetical protein
VQVRLRSARSRSTAASAGCSAVVGARTASSSSTRAPARRGATPSRPRSSSALPTSAPAYAAPAACGISSGTRTRARSRPRACGATRASSSWATARLGRRAFTRTSFARRRRTSSACWTTSTARGPAPENGRPAHGRGRPGSPPPYPTGFLFAGSDRGGRAMRRVARLRATGRRPARSASGLSPWRGARGERRRRREPRAQWTLLRSRTAQLSRRSRARRARVPRRSRRAEGLDRSLSSRDASTRLDHPTLGGRRLPAGDQQPGRRIAR